MENVLGVSFTFILLLWVLVSELSTQSPPLRLDEQRRDLGQATLRDIEKKTEGSPCWKEAVSRLNSTCKRLTDLEQSRLAVAFANCHLGKSGRQTYLCEDAMSIEDCTKDMDAVAFQTYTEFFTHTGHICYFLQSELWQERTENVITKLSDTSSDVVSKLEESLEYHRMLDGKQNNALSNQEKILEQDRRIARTLDKTRKDMDKAFTDMNEMAEKQKLLLNDMFGSLQASVDTIRSLMSLFLVEFIGYETFAWFVAFWLVIIFLPQFRYSRFKLYLVLFVELGMEIIVRRLYGMFVLGNAPPENLNNLHSYLWWCRYSALLSSFILYVWEWYSFTDYSKKNAKKLDKILTYLGLDTENYGNIKRSSSEGDVRVQQPFPVSSEGQGERDPSFRRSLPLQLGGHVGMGAIGIHHHGQQSHNMQEPGVEVTDGGMLSRPSESHDYGSRRHHPSGSGQHPLFYEPIPGIDPPVGHPDSPYTTTKIKRYISSLPVNHQYDPHEHSLLSTVAVADSDSNSTSGDSDDTFIPSNDPFVRQPIRIKPGSEHGSPGSKSGGGVPISSTPVAVNKRPMRGKGRTGSAAARRGRAGRRGQVSSGGDTGYLSSDNGELVNLSPGSWSRVEGGREKEVCEEKTQPFGTPKRLPQPQITVTRASIRRPRRSEPPPNVSSTLPPQSVDKNTSTRRSTARARRRTILDNSQSQSSQPQPLTQPQPSSSSSNQRYNLRDRRSVSRTPKL